jgi:hypothetical protein
MHACVRSKENEKMPDWFWRARPFLSFQSACLYKAALKQSVSVYAAVMEEGTTGKRTS